MSTEKVAYWFFRLNGCMTIENFVVHPDFGGAQHTDADILGMRLPYRSEGLRDSPMLDHSSLQSDRPLLFIAEVKRGRCKLNGPWTKRRLANLPRVLRAVGLHEPDEVDAVAEALYTEHRFVGKCSEVRLYAIGDEGGDDLCRRRPGVFPLLWADILGFIHDRFTTYQGVKADHEQWDEVGQRLFELAKTEAERDGFIREARGAMGLDQ
jgi:hypothetical protein